MHRWTSPHPQDDPPKDPEVHRWFRALGPPPAGSAPPDLRAHVRARIERLRAPRGAFAWIPHMEKPAWAAALAAVLVLSLGLNVWWGLLHLAPHPPGDSVRAGRLHIDQFQAGMADAKAVGQFVAAHPARWDHTTVVGFTPQASRTAFVRMGFLYADALAALHGGAVEAAAPRLEALTQAVTQVQAPPALPQYLRAVQTWVQQRSYDDAVLAQFLALFEPLYEGAYTAADQAEKVTLFRAGTWLENLALAAAVGDRAALRQGGVMLEEVRRDLARLPVPPEVSETLERVHRLTTARALTDQDIHTIRTLVQDVQRRLSE